MSLPDPENEWREYLHSCFGDSLGDMPADQKRELCLAFYAGVLVGFNKALDISSTPLGRQGAVPLLERFRRQLEAAAMRANLDRSDGNS